MRDREGRGEVREGHGVGRGGRGEGCDWELGGTAGEWR